MLNRHQVLIVWRVWCFCVVEKMDLCIWVESILFKVESKKPKWESIFLKVESISLEVESK
jgi:hypothetical protein